MSCLARYLGASDLVRMERVSRQWRAAVREADDGWARLYFRARPLALVSAEVDLREEVLGLAAEKAAAAARVGRMEAEVSAWQDLVRSRVVRPQVRLSHAAGVQIRLLLVGAPPAQTTQLLQTLVLSAQGRGERDDAAIVAFAPPLGRPNYVAVPGAFRNLRISIEMGVLEQADVGAVSSNDLMLRSPDGPGGGGGGEGPSQAPPIDVLVCVASQNDPDSVRALHSQIVPGVRDVLGHLGLPPMVLVLNHAEDAGSRGVADAVAALQGLSDLTSPVVEAVAVDSRHATSVDQLLDRIIALAFHPLSTDPVEEEDGGGGMFSSCTIF